MDLAFECYEDAMIFRVSCFIFLFRTNCQKGHLDDNHFCHCYGDFLKVTWSQLCLKFILNNYKPHWQQHFERHLTVEDFTDMDQHSSDNSFLGSYNEMNINKGAWKVAQKFESALRKTFYQYRRWYSTCFYKLLFLSNKSNS